MNAIELTLDAARRTLRTAEGSDDLILSRYARAVWSTITEPGDGAAGELVARLGAVDALRAVLQSGPVPDIPSDLAGGMARARSRWEPRLSAAHLEDAMTIGARAGVRLVTPEDEEWPDGLNDLGVHAPLALWVRGTLSCSRTPGVAVALVGARASTSYGDRVAAGLASELAADGVTIVSGAAYGIDGSAHRATLAVGGGTIAVVAGGAERNYPQGNASLIDDIASHGAVISEVPCGAAPTRWRFLQRNRLIAALAKATVVVEAGWRSGSLNTAGHAAALSRALGAVPGPVTSPASAGCHRLLREYGAECVTSADDVRELVGWTTGLLREDTTSGRPRTNDRSRIRDALSSRSWRVSEEVARRSGMSRSDAEMHLGLLELDGSVVRGPHGWKASPGRA